MNRAKAAINSISNSYRRWYFRFTVKREEMPSSIAAVLLPDEEPTDSWATEPLVATTSGPNAFAALVQITGPESKFMEWLQPSGPYTEPNGPHTEDEVTDIVVEHPTPYGTTVMSSFGTEVVIKRSAFAAERGSILAGVSFWADGTGDVGGEIGVQIEYQPEPFQGQHFHTSEAVRTGTRTGCR